MFKEKTSKLAKGSISYFTGGSGRPLIHLHGAGGVRPNAGLEALAENLTLYMPVLPGFDGTSEIDGIASMETLADLVADFIDKEFGEAVDVLGRSFGGWLAAWLAGWRMDGCVAGWVRGWLGVGVCGWLAGGVACWLAGRQAC